MKVGALQRVALFAVAAAIIAEAAGYALSMEAGDSAEVLVMIGLSAAAVVFSLLVCFPRRWLTRIARMALAAVAAGVLLTLNLSFLYWLRVQVLRNYDSFSEYSALYDLFGIALLLLSAVAAFVWPTTAPAGERQTTYPRVQ